VFQDRVTRFALTLFTFTFTFTLAVLVRIHDSVPAITGWSSALFSLLSLAVFLYLIDHVGKSLRPSGGFADGEPRRARGDQECLPPAS